MQIFLQKQEFLQFQYFLWFPAIPVRLVDLLVLLNYPLKACWNSNFWASRGTKISKFSGLLLLVPVWGGGYSAPQPPHLFPTLLCSVASHHSATTPVNENLLCAKKYKTRYESLALIKSTQAKKWDFSQCTRVHQRVGVQGKNANMVLPGTLEGWLLEGKSKIHILHETTLNAQYIDIGVLLLYQYISVLFHGADINITLQ